MWRRWLAPLVLCAAARGLDWRKGGGWVRTAPRREYDWRCWLMKARYNCQRDRRSPPADAWAHVGDRRTNATWRSLVAAAGGPVAVAARHRRRKRRNATHVVLLGNSYLRQVFESMACRWRVTGGVVVHRGPSMTIEDLASRRKDSVARLRLRAFGASDRPTCHGSRAGDYYVGRKRPANDTADCSDNVAMVEFDRALRVYFVFRPWASSPACRR